MKEEHNKEMEANMRERTRQRQTKADEAAKKLMDDYKKEAEQFFTEEEENAIQALDEAMVTLRRENEERLKELESKKAAIKLVVAAKTKEVEKLKEQLKTSLDDELKELRRKRETLESEEKELQKKLDEKKKAEEELKAKAAEVTEPNDAEKDKEDATKEGRDGDESVTVEQSTSNDDPFACLRTDNVTKALSMLGATLPPKAEDIKSEHNPKRAADKSPSHGSKRQRFETKEDVALFLIGDKNRRGSKSPARTGANQSSSSPRSPRAKKVLEFTGKIMTDVEEMKELKTHKEEAIIKADKMLKLKRTKKNVDPLYDKLKELKLVISSDKSVDDIPDYSFFTLLLPYCSKELSELPEIEAAETFRKKVCDFICASCEYSRVSNCHVLCHTIVIFPVVNYNT